MKKFIKIAFAVVAFAAVGLGSYKAYGSYTAANDMSEDDLLLTEDVLALSDPNPGGIPRNFDGGFKDSNYEVSVCENCGFDFGAGKCSILYNFHLSCSYTETKQVAAHMYDCWAGSRLTEAECKALMKAFGTHPKADCKGH